MSKFEGAWRRWSGRKQAHWVWDTRGAPLGDGMWVCSSCRRGNHNIPAYPDVNPSEFYGSWFCPNCGRRHRNLINIQVLFDIYIKFTFLPVFLT